MGNIDAIQPWTCIISGAQFNFFTVSTTPFAKKVFFDIKDKKKVAHLETPNYVNILKCAIENSDAVVHGSETIPTELSEFLKTQKVPVLGYELENQRDAYLEFYTDLVSGS